VLIDKEKCNQCNNIFNIYPIDSSIYYIDYISLCLLTRTLYILYAEKKFIRREKIYIMYVLIDKEKCNQCNNILNIYPIDSSIYYIDYISLCLLARHYIYYTQKKNLYAGKIYI